MIIVRTSVVAAAVAVMVSAAGCSESPKETVCERLRNITNESRDDPGSIVTDLEGVNVQALDESSRRSLTAAIAQVRSEFDRATGEVDG